MLDLASGDEARLRLKIADTARRHRGSPAAAVAIVLLMAALFVVAEPLGKLFAGAAWVEGVLAVVFLVLGGWLLKTIAGS